MDWLWDDAVTGNKARQLLCHVAEQLTGNPLDAMNSVNHGDSGDGR